MALIVEDGTGKPDAESYASVAQFKTYCDARGYAYTGKTDAQIEQALRRATEWIDARYGTRFVGIWAVSGQALQWPRIGYVFRGEIVPSVDLPRQLTAATCEAALRELGTPGALSPDVGAQGLAKRVRVGDVETEFSGAAVVGTNRPLFGMIDDLLAGLLVGSGGGYFGKAVRG